MNFKKLLVRNKSSKCLSYLFYISGIDLLALSVYLLGKIIFCRCWHLYVIRMYFTFIFSLNSKFIIYFVYWNCAHYYSHYIMLRGYKRIPNAFIRSLKLIIQFRSRYLFYDSNLTIRYVILCFVIFNILLF